MVQDVLASQALRCRWLLADEAFGRDTERLDAIAELGWWSLVEVPLDPPIWPVGATAATTPRAVVGRLSATAWTRHVLGNGTRGRRMADAVVPRVHARRDDQPGPEVWLILRRDPETGEQQAFRSTAPASVTAARLVALRGMRWPLEHICEVATQHVGMGDDEGRSWPGWHQHMTLVILAHFFLVRLQRRLNNSPGAEPGADLPAAQRPAAVAAASA